MGTHKELLRCDIYFADKLRLNEYGRPVFGEDYRADRYGPLGEAAYGLLMGNPFEQLALGSHGPLPFRVDQAWRATAEREANSRALSASDVDAPSRALDQVKDMSFDELVEITHEDRAHRAADGGRMRYEDMLDHDDPDYEIQAENLAESVRHAVF